MKLFQVICFAIIGLALFPVGFTDNSKDAGFATVIGFGFLAFALTRYYAYVTVLQKSNIHRAWIFSSGMLLLIILIICLLWIRFS